MPSHALPVPRIAAPPTGSATSCAGRRALLQRLRRASGALALAGASALAGCGSGGDGDAGYQGSAPLAGLELVITRLGPQTVQLDWSYDAAARSYLVARDGRPLATLPGTTLVDDSGFYGERYCYQVSGYDPAGTLVSYSAVGCITLY